MIRRTLPVLVCLVASAAAAAATATPPAPRPSPPPPPPPPPACQANNTAIVAFGNRSTTNTTHDVYFDGSKIFTLAPGQF